jgi:glycogen operon protein
MICFNAHHDWVEFNLPNSEYGQKWRLIFDTGDVSADETERIVEAGGRFWVRDRSFIVLQRTT